MFIKLPPLLLDWPLLIEHEADGQRLAVLTGSLDQPAALGRQWNVCSSVEGIRIGHHAAFSALSPFSPCFAFGSALRISKRFVLLIACGSGYSTPDRSSQL